jgi:hypothetical protein
MKLIPAEGRNPRQISHRDFLRRTDDQAANPTQSAGIAARIFPAWPLPRLCISGSVQRGTTAMTDQLAVDRLPASAARRGPGGVPQVIGAAGERGGGQVRAERGLAGSVPDAAVDRLAELSPPARAHHADPVRQFDGCRRIP